MARLGYEHYGAHGNDAGSLISPEVGRADPEPALEAFGEFLAARGAAAV